MGQSWNGSAFTSVYTINASGTQDIENSSNASLKNGFSKYQDSKTKMENLLENGGGNIYGLHFMDSTIALESNGHEVIAANAKINGDSFTNCPMTVLTSI